MSTVEEIEARRAARRTEHDKDRLAQEALDLEAIDALEAAAGEPLLTMTANGYKAGASVKIAYRAPSPVEYKRYCDTVGRAQQRGDSIERRKSQETLATSCWVYPEPGTDARKAMLEAFPGVLISLAIEVAKAAEMRSEEEGKG